MKKKTTPGKSRSVTFDIFLPEESKEKYQAVINSIRMYRAVARQVWSALSLASIAGANITITTKKDKKNNDRNNIVLAPDRDNAREIMSNAYDGKHLYNRKTGEVNNHLYELKGFSMSVPTWQSFVSDSIRNTINQYWNALDPKLNATRSYLTIQGARVNAKFANIGIAIPKAFLPKNSLHEHKVKVKWDHDIGDIEFILNRMDGGRYHIWKSLRGNADGWSLGTIYLNEHNGKLRLTVSYKKPDKKISLDFQSVMKVEFTDDINNFICMSTDDKLFGADKISFAEALNWLNQLRHRGEHYDIFKAAVGIMTVKKDKNGTEHISGKCPRKGRLQWKAIQERVSRLTYQRTLGVKDRNHCWTRRIVSHAIKNNCGKLLVINLPEKEIFGHPWGWHNFNEFLKYKANELHIAIEYVSNNESLAA